METATERLEPKLREAALRVLRRHGIAEDELQFEQSKPGQPVYSLIRGHRVRVHVDDRSAAFKVRAGNWSGARPDYPTAGSFIAAFEEALHGALTGAAAR